MLKTINGNLRLKSLITFALVLPPDPNNKNSLVFTRALLLRGRCKHSPTSEENILPKPASVGKPSQRLGSARHFWLLVGLLLPGGVRPSVPGFVPVPEGGGRRWWSDRRAFQARGGHEEALRKAGPGCLVLPAQSGH